MKTLLVLATLAATASISFADPVNTKCPVKTENEAKASVTTKHDGKEVGFCCNGCKKKFEAEPEKYPVK